MLQQHKNIRHVPMGFVIASTTFAAWVLCKFTHSGFALIAAIFPAGITLFESVRAHYRKKADVVAETDISAMWQAVNFGGLAIVAITYVSAYLIHRTFFTSGIVCVAVMGTVLWQSRRWLGESYSAVPRVFPNHKMISGGPYRLVRHPMYTCLIALLPALGLVFGAFRSPATAAGALVGTTLFGAPLIKRALLEEELLGVLRQEPEAPRFIPTLKSLWRYLREPFLP